jgi:DNA-binding GntR family transcriptional regulator
MDLTEVDTRHAYEYVREKIITLALAPGTLLNEQALAEASASGVGPVREALQWLAYEGLVVITPRHGLYVAEINRADLEQLGEIRLTLEPLCARLAAQRCDQDDWAVLVALRQQQLAADPSNSERMLDFDHKFHQALVRAARNKYLARSLDHLLGLSRRLWHVALPQLDFLSDAVAEHLSIMEAIRAKDADRAEAIMGAHVKAFHDRVRRLL